MDPSSYIQISIKEKEYYQETFKGFINSVEELQKENDEKSMLIAAQELQILKLQNELKELIDKVNNIQDKNINIYSNQREKAPERSNHRKSVLMNQSSSSINKGGSNSMNNVSSNQIDAPLKELTPLTKQILSSVLDIELMNKRGENWSKLVPNNLKITLSLYQNNEINLKVLISAGEKTINKYIEDINKDIDRTFHEISKFGQDEAGSERLGKLLYSYAIYRNDFGYVQGMNYLAGVIIMNCPNFESFVIFANIIHHDIFHNIYTFDQKWLKTYSNLLEKLLKMKGKQIYEHLSKLKYNFTTFIIESVITIFSSMFSFDNVLMLIDFILGDIEYRIFNSMVGIIISLEKELLEIDTFELILMALKKPGKIKNEDSIIESATKFIFQKNIFEKYKDESVKEFFNS